MSTRVVIGSILLIVGILGCIGAGSSLLDLLNNSNTIDGIGGLTAFPLFIISFPLVVSGWFLTYSRSRMFFNVASGSFILVSGIGFMIVCMYVFFTISNLH